MEFYKVEYRPVSYFSLMIAEDTEKAKDDFIKNNSMVIDRKDLTVSLWPINEEDRKRVLSKV